MGFLNELLGTGSALSVGKHNNGPRSGEGDVFTGVRLSTGEGVWCRGGVWADPHPPPLQDGHCHASLLECILV